MGATLRQRDPEFDQPSNTEQLFNWITQVRTKKIKYLRNRRRNIRVEAVLGYALSQAEQELRNKQVERINRWQKLKKQIEVNNNSYDTACGYEVMDHQDNYSDNNCNGNAWCGNLCPELNSLDKFMSKLGEIKVPLQR